MMQEQINQGEFDEQEIDESLARLNAAKEKYIRHSDLSVDDKIKQANKIIAQEASLVLEQELANSATTLVKNASFSLPISVDKIKVLHLLVKNEQEFLALQQAIKNQWKKAGLTQFTIQAIIVDDESDVLAQIRNIERLKGADLVISTIDAKYSSAVDLGGVEDLLTQVANQKKSNQVDKEKSVSYGQLLALQLTLAKQNQIKTVLIAKSSPYLINSYIKLADAVLLTFDDRIYLNNHNKIISPGFNASMAIVVGNQKAKGVLPVTLN